MSNRIINNITEFARLELLKERAQGVKMKHQSDDIGVTYSTLRDFMRGYYNNNPLSKIINYLIEKGGVVLCPLQKEVLSKF